MGAPGGIYDIGVFGVPAEMSQYVSQQKFCFIPSVSALALTNWQSMLNTSFNNADFYSNGTSKFQYYFAPVSNQLHTNCNSASGFLYHHLIEDYMYNQDVYIQNEILNSNRIINARNIYIGNHVTTSKPYGDVIISNNSIIDLHATGDVNFDTGFECSFGSSLDVSNN